MKYAYVLIKVIINTYLFIFIIIKGNKYEKQN